MVTVVVGWPRAQLHVIELCIMNALERDRISRTEQSADKLPKSCHFWLLWIFREKRMKSHRQRNDLRIKIVLLSQQFNSLRINNTVKICGCYLWKNLLIYVDKTKYYLRSALLYKVNRNLRISLFSILISSFCTSNIQIYLQDRRVKCGQHAKYL